MKRTRYNKMGYNPHSKKFEEVGKVLLSEEEAKTLNMDSKKLGLKYEPAEEKKNTSKK